VANFTRIYTDTQREAVIAARLDDGLTAKQVVEAAACGELADGPFHIPVGTVYRVGREGAREREAQRFLELARRDPNQAKDELVARQLALIDREMDRLQNANELDVATLSPLIRLTQAVGKADRATITRTQPLQEPPAPTSGLAEHLREAHEQSPPTAAPNHEPPTATATTCNTPRDNSPNPSDPASRPATRN
jgi:hypothetical protein